jgi:hypothetical protein
MFELLTYVFTAGGLGGLINALTTDNYLLLPIVEPVDASRTLRPGLLGNALVGGIAATVSWGLYGPFSATYLVGGPLPSMQPGLTYAGAGGAMLVGIAGARWLTSEVDKKLLRMAGVKAAAAKPTAELVHMFSTGSPSAVLRAADEAPRI